MADVFISYSRKDREFVGKLHETLKQRQRDTWVDWEGIPPSAEWENEVYAAIDAAHSFVFVVGPDSVKSEICLKEVNHAIERNKRLVPLVRQDVNPTVVPESVRKLNWIFFRETDHFDSAFELLIKALDSDLDYLRSHTRLLTRAIEWQHKKQDSSLLLTGNDLKDAENWLAQGGEKDPRPTTLHTQFIHTSRNAATKRLRITLGGLAVAMLVISALALVAYNQRNIAQEQERFAQAKKVEAEQAAEKEKSAREVAEERRREAERQARIATARRLAAEASAALPLYPQRSVLLAVEAVKTTSPYGFRIPSAEQALRDALAACSGYGISGHAGRVAVRALSSDKHWLATGGSDKTVRLWNLRSPDVLKSSIVFRGHEASITSAEISEDNRWLITGSADRTARVWDLTARDPSKTSKVLPNIEGPVRVLTISADNRWVVTATDPVQYTDPAPVVRLWDRTALDLAPRILQVGSGRVVAAWISPDNRQVIALTENGTARMWDLTAQDPTKSVVTLQGHESMLHQAAISANFKWLATASEDRDGSLIYLWDLGKAPASALRVLRDYKGAVSVMTISHDERLLVTGSFDKAIYIWDLTAKATSVRPTELSGHEDAITSVAISQDNRWLVSGGSDHTVRVWDLAASPSQSPIVLRGHSDRITSVEITPDNRWVVTASDDRTVRVWELSKSNPTAAPSTLRGHDSGGISVSIIPAGPSDYQILTTAGDGTARLWDLNATGAYPSSSGSRGQRESIRALAVSSDGRWLAAASDDRTVYLWYLADSESSKKPIALTGDGKPIASVTISPNNRWLAVLSKDVSAQVGLRLWKLAAANPAKTPAVSLSSLNSNEITALAFSPNNRWLATASRYGTASLYDLSAEDPLGRSITVSILGGGWHDNVQLADSALSINTIAISPNGRWLITGSGGGTVYLWDLPTVLSAAQRARSSDNQSSSRWRAPGEGLPKPSIVLRGHLDISTMTVSRDSRWLVTGSNDKTARLWDLNAKDPSQTSIVLKGHTDTIATLAVSLDGHWLVTGSADHTLRFWDLTAKDPSRTPIILRGHDSELSSTAISPDSRWLVSASKDGVARLWDLSVSDPSLTSVVLRGHKASINAIAFGSNQRWVITGSSDGMARLWELGTEELFDRAHRLAGRNLWLDEWQQYFPGEPYRKTFENLPGLGN